jgi:hypothetical protein
VPRPLPKRAWIGTRGWVVVGPVLTIAVPVLVHEFLGDSPNPFLSRLWLLVLVLAAVATFLGALSRGVAATDRRVCRVRGEWADAHGWAIADRAEIDPRSAALALPRAWATDHAVASATTTIHGRRARIQTWALRSAAGSTRHPTRREIVEVGVSTGNLRLVAVRRGGSIDPALVDPRWSGTDEHVEAGTAMSGPRVAQDLWGDRVRHLVGDHDDLPFALSIGSDRVVVLALDDPRPATAMRRLDLALAVADHVQAHPPQPF